MTRLTRGVRGLLTIAGALALVFAARPARAQMGGAQSGGFQMPDMKQMSGIPRPVTDLPNGAVGVRLIRGDLSNNIANHDVELHVGSKVLTRKTDDSGHVVFDGVAPGTTVKASANVDGEDLESQEFPVPDQGGVRLLLVATDKAKAAENAKEAAAPPVTGLVVLGGESRIVMEPGDGSVQIYYLLDIMNTARVRVNPPSLFVFDMPTGAVNTTILDGSSRQASVTGTHVRVEGPFAPGQTVVQVACELPFSGGSLALSQTFPAQLEQLAVIVKKVGDTTLASPQVANQQDMAASGETFIAAQGPSVAAGQPIAIALSGMPHHSVAPRWTALTLAAAVIVIGVVAAARPEDEKTRAAERQRLVARRDRLFHDLVRLESDQRRGRADPERYAARREELVGALEHVYGALDSDDSGPGPTDRAGLAA